ncbi:D-glycero-beta-D-manno-heptose 1,7-bisphosphate 7-phosphatase [Poseidonibacter lekithochrous]|uniref:D-glycero-beta-D-manno-heptose 1,7-bisphosphate 7-phosphatase n=1 Tax=Poseidonibacter lekithochrous TaxID=1904463 RepID=UPI0008FC3EF0|nr:D-glycero-beta-D-manno-heptose 1,7-bisphosphate 7-phosphatase [Poseidonibacter lekithochrous]QKJ22279.1 D,D-heptose 1,7-bisphosphate phosphatase [Poseidonibacter lekithochrous]
MKKALFLDRDGVINIEKNYLYKISDFEFLDGVFETCRYFQRLGYLIIIITNQAGIARGKYTEKDFKLLTNWMTHKFEIEKVDISKVYYCSHHPDFTGECECRKPKPKMLFDAEKDFDLDLRKSILIGDKNSDIEAGINAGIIHNYLISTGHPIIENNYSVQILSNLRELKDLF